MQSLQSLLRALVVSKVDCYSTVLAGISGSLLDRLQSALNATHRLVFSARRSEHVTPVFRPLHWLKVPESVWSVSELSTESVGSRRELVANIVFTPPTPTRQNSFVASAVCIGHYTFLFSFWYNITTEQYSVDASVSL